MWQGDFMADSPKKEMLIDALETAPSVIFILLWRVTDNLEMAGWTGVVIAVAVLLGFLISNIHFNPILLGINFHLAIITPVIVGLYHAGATHVAEVIEGKSYVAVLLTIFVTGCVLTVCSSTGFLGSQVLPRAIVRRRSLIMLVGSAAAVVWAMIISASHGFIAVGLPIIGLFALRHALLIRNRHPKANKRR